MWMYSLDLVLCVVDDDTAAIPVLLQWQPTAQWQQGWTAGSDKWDLCIRFHLNRYRVCKWAGEWMRCVSVVLPVRCDRAGVVVLLCGCDCACGCANVRCDCASGSYTPRCGCGPCKFKWGMNAIMLVWGVRCTCCLAGARHKECIHCPTNCIVCS